MHRVPDSMTHHCTTRSGSRCDLPDRSCASQEVSMAKQPSPNVLLQRERMRHFLTQSELAEIIGVDTKTVQRWELGLRRPRAYYMRKLCEYFGKTPEALGFPDGPHAVEGDGWTGGHSTAPAPTNDHACRRILTYLLLAGGMVIAIIVAWMILRPSW